MSYLWQFYLPRLSSMEVFKPSPGLPLYDIWITEGWGAFGWLDVRMSGWIYPVLTSITGIVAVLGAAILVVCAVA